jgi:plastocyanin
LGGDDTPSDGGDTAADDDDASADGGDTPGDGGSAPSGDGSGGGEILGIGGTPSVAADEVAATVIINEDDSFDPPIVEIEPGSAVEWDNQTGEERQIHANDRLNDGHSWEFEADLEAGGRARFVFEEDGKYGYHEAEETWFRMCGAVAVGSASADDISGLRCEQ